VKFMSEVEARTNGRVKFEAYWLNSLVPSTDLPQAVRDGVVDMARIHGGQSPGLLPIANMGTLPALGVKLLPTVNAWMDMAKNYEPLVQEYAKYKVHPLFAFGTTDVNLCTVAGKKVTTIADLQGLKIRAVGVQAQVLQALGAVPVPGTAGEIYTMLERGTIDGVVGAPNFMTAYGMETVIKYYHRPIDFGSVTGVIGINIDVWNSLPPDIQQIMTDLEDEMNEFVAEDYVAANETELAKMIAAGAEVVELDPSVQQQLTETSRDVVWNKWVSDAPAGVDRQAAIDYFLQAYEAAGG